MLVLLLIEIEVVLVIANAWVLKNPA